MHDRAVPRCGGVAIFFSYAVGVMLFADVDAFLQRTLMGALLLLLVGLLDDMISQGVYPIVISMQNGRERMSYIPSKCSAETMRFINSRPGDPRFNPVETCEELHNGKIFYFMCMDKKEKLLPFYEKYREQYQCIYQIDMYFNDPWLDILPKGTSKANAIKQVAEYYQCDRIVAFGDGMNDVEMFQLADEAYAVENAVPELKALATDIIDCNDNDGVANWLKTNYK